jgi:transcriptional regulator of acetoin/glycerol metabolism
MDERTTIASNRAQQILTPDDYAILSTYARDAEARGETLEQVIALAGDRSIRLTAKPVLADGDVVGAVVRLREKTETKLRAVPARTAGKLFPAMVGDSAVMTQVRTAAARAVGCGAAVCITGERGTGRAHLARLMAKSVADAAAVIECDPERQQSGRAVEELEAAVADDRPIVCLHVDQVPADDADRVGQLLRPCLDSGRLFMTAYQLSGEVLEALPLVQVHEVRMPPLRSRKGDIPLLVAAFLSGDPWHGALTASGRLLHALTQAEWPGNVADLRDLLRSAAGARKTGTLCVTDLGDSQRRTLDRGRLSRLEAAELEQIRQALAEARGNRCSQPGSWRSAGPPSTGGSTATPAGVSTWASERRWCPNVARLGTPRSAEP